MLPRIRNADDSGWEFATLAHTRDYYISGVKTTQSIASRFRVRNAANSAWISPTVGQIKFRNATDTGWLSMSGTGLADIHFDGMNGASEVYYYPNVFPTNGHTTMVLRCNYRSNGWFAAEPGGHGGIFLRTVFDATPPGWQSGRGIIIGDATSVPTWGAEACPSRPSALFEVLHWNGSTLPGNSVYGGASGACSPVMSDGETYEITITTTDNGVDTPTIEYVVKNEDGSTLYSAWVEDTNNTLTGVNDAGVLFSLLSTFSSGPQPWSVDITNIGVWTLP